MPRKLALVIGVSEYGEGLEPFPGAVNGAGAIKQVLENKDQGDFEQIKLLINPNLIVMQAAILDLFVNAERYDLVLLFFTGHGIIDDSNQLYLTTSITSKAGFQSETFPGSLLYDLMNGCISGRQIVILDCCYSGAFPEKWIARSDGFVNNIKQQLGSKGRVVLTSSPGLPVSFDYESPGIYTHHLVEGIKTGVADRNKDGMVSIDELHEYAKAKVQQAKPAMKPKICFVDKESCEIVVSKALKRESKSEYRRSLEYRCLVEHYSNSRDGWFSLMTRDLLYKKCGKLGLSTEEKKKIEDEVLERFRQILKIKYDNSKLLPKKKILPKIAKKVEDEVLEPLRQYWNSLEKYEEYLKEVANQEKYLNQDTRKKLRDFQRFLGLKDDDIAPIHQIILPESKTEKQLLEVDLKTEIQYQRPENDLSSEFGVDYTRLRDFLAAGKWLEADTETVYVMIKCMDREEEGWLDTKNIENFPCTDLRTIDSLWVKYSNGHFGFSVQKRIWMEYGGKPGEYSSAGYSEFSARVEWSVGKGSYGIVYSQDAPKGHLPINWALRSDGSYCGRGIWSSLLPNNMKCLFARAHACNL